MLLARGIIGIVLGTVAAMVLLANLRILITNRKTAAKASYVPLIGAVSGSIAVLVLPGVPSWALLAPILTDLGTLSVGAWAAERAIEKVRSRGNLPPS